MWSATRHELCPFFRYGRPEVDNGGTSGSAFRVSLPAQVFLLRARLRYDAAVVARLAFELCAGSFGFCLVDYHADLLSSVAGEAVPIDAICLGWVANEGRGVLLEDYRLRAVYAVVVALGVGVADLAQLVLGSRDGGRQEEEACECEAAHFVLDVYVL